MLTIKHIAWSLLALLVIAVFSGCESRGSEKWVLEFERQAKSGMELSAEEVKHIVDRMMRLERKEDRSIVVNSIGENADWEVIEYFVERFLSETVQSQREFVDNLSIALAFVQFAEGAGFARSWDVPSGLYEPPGKLRTEKARREFIERWKAYLSGKKESAER